MLYLDSIFEGFSSRIIFLTSCIIGLFIFLLSALCYVQVYQNEKHANQVSSQCLRKVMVNPVRGRIISSDGYIMADSTVVFNIVFHFSEMRQPGRSSRTVNFIAEKIVESAQIIGAVPTALQRKKVDELFKNSFNSLSAAQRYHFKEYWKITSLKNTYFPNLDEATAWEKLNSDVMLCRDLEHKAMIGYRPFFRALNFGRDIAIRLQNLKRANSIWSNLSANAIWRALRYNEDNFREKVLQELSDVDLIKILGGEREILFTSIKRHPGLYPYLAFDELDERQVGIISAHMPRILGMELQISYRRIYPYNTLAAHLLGFTFNRLPPRNDFGDGNKKFDYVMREPSGFSGLEARYDAELTGKAGVRYLLVDTLGYSREVIDGRASENGDELVLNIDSKAQDAAEKAFLERHPDKLGAIAVMDVETGAIMALASFPNFNLNTATENYNLLERDDKNKPLLNRAISEQYEPGSIVKPLVALAAFENGAFSPDYLGYCDGWSYLHNRQSNSAVRTKPRCSAANRGGHGELDIYHAIAQSCNPFFTKIGVAIGLDALNKMYSLAGFGLKSGIDVAGEINGVLPDRAVKQRRLKQQWNAFDTAMVSIGHGDFLVTPIQALCYVAALANGGKVMVPQLVKQIQKVDGTIVRAFKPQIKSFLEVNLNYLEVIQEGMRQTVWESYGAAKLAQNSAIELAGKTGTANLGANRNTWFVCYGPVEKPKYACMVFVRNGHYGGTSAAPVAADFFRRWLGDVKSD